MKGETLANIISQLYSLSFLANSVSPVQWQSKNVMTWTFFLFKHITKTFHHIYLRVILRRAIDTASKIENPVSALMSMWKWEWNNINWEYLVTMKIIEFCIQQNGLIIVPWIHWEIKIGTYVRSNPPITWEFWTITYVIWHFLSSFASRFRYKAHFICMHSVV